MSSRQTETRGHAARARLPVRAAALGATALAGASAVWAAFHPGLMTPDPLGQLWNARQGLIDDVHSPLMTVMFGWADALVPGPLLMLLFQNALFWGALAALAHECIRRTPWACAAVALVGFQPPVFALLGTIWKDLLFGGSLVLAVALCARFARDRAPAARWAAMGALLFALCMRKNGAPAALPLCVFLWAPLGAPRPRVPSKPLKAAAVAVGRGLAATIALLVLSRAVGAALSTRESTPSLPSLLIHDLSAISLARNESLLPEEYRVSLPRLAESYDRCIGWSIMRHGTHGLAVEDASEDIGPEGAPPFSYTRDAGRIGRLRSAWWEAVTGNFGSYLHHRLALFGLTLGLGTDEVYFPFNLITNWNEMGFGYEPGRFGQAVGEALVAIRNTPWFRGWVYFALCLAVCAAACLPARRRPAGLPGLPAAVAASGILYVLPFGLLAVSCEFRFVWWTALAALVIPVLMLGGRRSP